jgi:hypothetical protein
MHYISPKDVSFEGLQFSEGTCSSAASGWLETIGMDKLSHTPGTDGVVGSGNATTGSPVNSPAGYHDKISTGYFAPGDTSPYNGKVVPAYATGDFLWPIPWRFRVPGTANWIPIGTANQHFTSSSTGSATAEKADSGQVTTQAADPDSTPPGWTW